MTTHRDPLAESFRAALDLETPGTTETMTSDDDALLARAIDRAMAASVTAVPAASSAATPAPIPARVVPPAAASTGSLRALNGARQARLRMLRYALPAAAALVASVAMAAVYMEYRSTPTPANDVTHAPHDEAPPASTGPIAPPSRVTVPAPATEAAPTISIDDLPSVAPRASGSAGRTDRAHVVVDPLASATPAELFRDANASRRAGEVDTAAQLYTALVTRHADTPEALAGRVSLGRLLLDRKGDAPGALVQFDAYLRSSSSDHALAEEARLGRALVFQRQGRQEEERRAWHELLERHPDSLYASRARERLRVLAPAEIAPAPSSPSP